MRLFLAVPLVVAVSISPAVAGAKKKAPPDPTPTQSPMQCGPFKDILNVASSKYHETPILMGTMNDGKVYVTMLANEDTGTWTILSVGTNGYACIVGMGENFSPAGPAKPSGRPS